jgi:photosystem II stability/assembly factor-like uncharacterized protein
LPTGAGAVTWSPIASGTSSAITSIEYQTSSRFWFTTATGEIYGRGGGGNFEKQQGPSGLALNDIEFLPAPSEVGIAVGNGGQVLRTINGGNSWEAVAIAANVLSKTAPNDCTATQALGDVYSVRFASPTVVYIIGQGSQLGRSVGTAATVGSAGTWNDANWENIAREPAGQRTSASLRPAPTTSATRFSPTRTSASSAPRSSARCSRPQTG